MSSIKPYKVDVPQEKIDRLYKKLELTDLPDELDGAEWVSLPLLPLPPSSPFPFLL